MSTNDLLPKTKIVRTCRNCGKVTTIAASSLQMLRWANNEPVSEVFDNLTEDNHAALLDYACSVRCFNDNR